MSIPPFARLNVAATTSSLLLTLGLIAFALPGQLVAKTASIADTGYQLEVPDTFNVHRPAGAPDILLQADRPDGNGTIQVVRRPGGGSATDFIADYEAQMQQALGSLNLQTENMRTVAGRSCTYRRYQSFADGMQIRVQAVFYADANQGFILHSIDTAVSAPEFERALLSLQAPHSAAPPSSRAASSGGRQPIGQTSYSFVPPPGWTPAQACQQPGLAFNLPDKGAALELTWLDVSGQVGDAPAFLDQTLTQVESSFGPGWHERERSPNRTGNTNVLFKRYGGKLGDQAAELMILGVTDGQSLVLAYGYFAELGRDSAGPAMRQAILSVAGGAAAPPVPTTSATPSHTPPANDGWGSPTSPPTTPSSPSTASANNGWGSPPPASAATGTGWGDPPPTAISSVPPSGAYEALVVDDAGYEFNKPKSFQLAQRSEGQTQWADPNITGPKIVMVLQSMFRNAGNTVDSVRDDLVGQVNNSSAASMVSQHSTTLNGMKTHQLHFTLNRGGEPQHFRFLVLDLPNDYVGTISFTAPESQNAMAEQHFAEVLRTIQAVGRTASPPPSSPPASLARAPRPEPATAQDCYYAIADAVAAQDWSWVAAHLTDETLLNYCRNFRNNIPDADYTEADAIDDPSGTFRAYLNWRYPREDLARLFEASRTITGQRVENPDMVLVMTQRTNGGENYLWFKRIKGRWMCDIR
ncbi:hypothetical protein [Actomonas aquatica]|uniref:DUF1795 domain-containing protein n=1 Tax=Actomonas aquatica TaxID=2866162 RepID=A0ABZ1CA05_9BACT|nr:hypothetical protein [Opitutus sp. WL0086]WRQ88132.1 hypothetical protein K1X11_001850 [Opitutus sp. WL0086]